MGVFSIYDLEPELPSLNILDVGAAFDDPRFPPPYATLVAAKRARVTGFEPSPLSCARLTQTFGPPHQFLPMFLGTGGPAKFHLTQQTDCSSLLRPNIPVLELFNHLAEALTVVDVTDVETVRLDDIPEIGDIDYFKIDVQGAELDIFRSADRALGTAVAIQAEVEFIELYENQPLFADIDSHLRSRGFWFHTFVGMMSLSVKPITAGAPDMGLNQRLYADAVYVRHPSQLGSVSSDKLRKLAVVLHDLYRSYDLAHFYLNAADARDGGTLGQRYLERLTQP
jgi:protein O-GlcNAc transferase